MIPQPPIVLRLETRADYALVLAVLLVAFFLRVAGQVLAATVAPGWLPPMRRWYSGLLPYRYLLPAQVVFLVVMTAIVVQVADRTATLGTPSMTTGAWMVWASYVYALGMVVRALRYVTARPERRGVLIPIIFHFVLAAFLFTYGSAAVGGKW